MFKLVIHYNIVSFCVGLCDRDNTKSQVQTYKLFEIFKSKE